MSATVVVSAGTYHLPFNRLVDWMEPWVQAHPDVRVVMQHGPGRPLPGAENHAILSHAELLALCAEATAVVLQGGAGGVMDMRQLGRIPIVVPRVPVDDEVVDDHQLIFSEQVSRLGLIHRATTRDELVALLNAALAGDLPTRTAAGAPTSGVSAVGDLLRELPRPASRSLRARRFASSARSLVRRGH
ncbi:glycosyltransferase [Lysobacter korlensis]|uniref:Glycosyltransferase n=1 Tax=Lysobacter korlensis TaxID=553636 RepID=A0ABV6RVQ5_9GAMM